jgi:sugar-specific transcriptional regulator TrmB
MKSMLNKEELQAMAKCSNDNCNVQCNAYPVGKLTSDCIRQSARTALELMEQVDKLKEELSSCYNTILEDNNNGCNLQQENYRLKELLEETSKELFKYGTVPIHFKMYKEIDKALKGD